MNYDEFKEYVVNNVLNYCPPDYTASIHSVTKNNDTVLDGLILKHPEDTITPTVYINRFYSDYINNDKPLEQVVSEIADASLSNRIDKSPDFNKIFDNEYIKNHTYYRLCSVENNQANLSTRPHMIYGNNLAIVYQVLVNDSSIQVSNNGLASFALNNDFMNRLDLSVDELHQYAEKNTPELFPARFSSMLDTIMDIVTDPGMSDEEVEVIRESMNIPEDDVMHVLTNEQKLYGAAVMLYPDFLKNISEKFGNTDFYVLPSSVHEVIILPHTEKYEVEILKDMVQSVNSTEVLPEEVLSDNVYKYDHKANELFLVKEESNYKVQNSSIDLFAVIGKLFPSNQKDASTYCLEL